MSTINRFLGFVKSQEKFQENQAKKNTARPSRQQFHEGLANTFRELEEFLKQVKEKPMDQVSPAKSNMVISGAEYKKLPPEVVAELSITDSDRLDFLLQDIIEQNSGAASLDRIIVDLYKQTEEVHTRSSVNARLYRMMQKGKIDRDKASKGVYLSAGKNGGSS